MDRWTRRLTLKIFENFRQIFGRHYVCQTIRNVGIDFDDECYRRERRREKNDGKKRKVVRIKVDSRKRNGVMITIKRFCRRRITRSFVFFGLIFLLFILLMFSRFFSSPSSNVGLIIVSDDKFVSKFANQLETLRQYAKKHGYVFFQEDPSHAVECKLHSNFFFRKQCFVSIFLKRLPENFVLFVFDGDTIARPGEDVSLSRWIDLTQDSDLVFYEREWNFEIMAGNYFVRNTAFTRGFLLRWSTFEFHAPKDSFTSSDNGALHLVLLEYLQLEDSKHCFDIYHSLPKMSKYASKPFGWLSPYYDFVACCREKLGPGRRWLVQKEQKGVITVLNRYRFFA